MARARKTITPDPYAKPIAKPLPPEQSLPGKLKQFQSNTRANFELVSPYGAAGDQPKAIEELTEGFNRGEQFQTLLGVTGSGKTFTMANVIKNVGKPTLILTHNKTLAAQLYQEFKAFFPHNAVEYFVSYYDYFQPEAYIPHTDTFIEKDASINDEIDKLRLRATANLLTRRDVIIVASVSCIYGLGSPSEYFDLMVRIKKGDVYDRDKILHDLVRIQYTRNDFSLERGSFRVHGDVIEIHPSYDEEGLRIELFGDEVDRLVRFNIVTGEVTQELNEMTIAPAKHFVTKEEGRAGILQRMQVELTERLAELDKEGKVLESARLSSRTRYDMEMIRETGQCSGIENYSRIIENRAPGTRPFTLIDYFGDDWLLMIDESHVSIPQVGGMAEGDKSRKTTLVQYGFRLPCALDNRPMNFAEFEYMYPKQVLFVSATPGDYELTKTGGVVTEQTNRPTGLLDPKIEMFPIKGQMDVLLYRIEEVVKNGDRVLVTTLTKKMAQDLTDFFVEAGIRARYLHSDIKTLERHELIRGLRTGRRIRRARGHQPAARRPGPARSEHGRDSRCRQGRLLAQLPQPYPDDGPREPQRERHGTPFRGQYDRQLGKSRHRNRPPPQRAGRIQQGTRHHAEIRDPQARRRPADKRPARRYRRRFRRRRLGRRWQRHPSDGTAAAFEQDQEEGLPLLQARGERETERNHRRHTFVIASEARQSRPAKH